MMAMIMMIRTRTMMMMATIMMMVTISNISYVLIMSQVLPKTLHMDLLSISHCKYMTMTTIGLTYG